MKQLELFPLMTEDLLESAEKLISDLKIKGIQSDRLTTECREESKILLHELIKKFKSLYFEL